MERDVRVTQEREREHSAENWRGNSYPPRVINRNGNLTSPSLFHIPSHYSYKSARRVLLCGSRGLHVAQIQTHAHNVYEQVDCYIINATFVYCGIVELLIEILRVTWLCLEMIKKRAGRIATERPVSRWKSPPFF